MRRRFRDAGTLAFAGLVGVVGLGMGGWMLYQLPTQWVWMAWADMAVGALITGIACWGIWHE